MTNINQALIAYRHATKLAKLQIKAKKYTSNNMQTPIAYRLEIDALKAKLKINAFSPLILSYESHLIYAEQVTGLQSAINDHKALLPASPDALQKWSDLHRALLTRLETAQQQATEIRAQIPDDVFAALERARRGRAPRQRAKGAGRPTGGRRSPQDWQAKLAPYLDHVRYDPDTGTITYRGRPPAPSTPDRLTPARAPLGVVVAAAMGHVARAVCTEPACWRWDTLLLTERGEGLPDIYTDGRQTPVDPALQARKAKHAERKRYWRERKAQERLREQLAGDDPFALA